MLTRKRAKVVPESCAGGDKERDLLAARAQQDARAGEEMFLRMSKRAVAVEVDPGIQPAASGRAIHFDRSGECEGRRGAQCADGHAVFVVGVVEVAAVRALGRGRLAGSASRKSSISGRLPGATSP